MRLEPGAGRGPTDPSPEITEAVDAAVAAHAGERGPLLVVLHDVMAQLGHVPDAAVRLLAQRLNLSRAEVHGVVSFYSGLRTTPPGRCVVQLCRGEACQAVGAEALVAGVGDRLGVGLDQTRADGAITLGEVFCFGNCALGPSGTVDGRLYGRLTVDRVAALVSAALDDSAPGAEDDEAGAPA